MRAHSYFCRNRGAPLYFCKDRTPECVLAPRCHRFSSFCWKFLDPPLISCTVFILIATYAPISAHPLCFEVINYKIINPHSHIYSLSLLSSIWLGISLKLAKIIIFWVNPCNKFETNKCPPNMIYLNALGAKWSEYGTSCLTPWERNILLVQFTC